MANRKKIVGLSLSGLLFMLPIVAGCGASRYAGSSAQPTESDVLVTLVSEGVQPSLTQVVDTASRLESSVQELCTTPSAQSLEQAQAAWREAYLAWRRAEPFLFGPADGLHRQIGKWPVNEVVLKAAVESPDLRHMLGQADSRGYAAVEYLLFAPENAAAATTEGRCSHLQDVTKEIARVTADVKQEWENGIAGEYISAGDGKPFLIPADALSVAFSETLNVTKRMLRDRIGAPSGFFEAEVSPEDLEAWRSRSTRDGFQATLEGIRLAMAGGGDSSFAMLVATKDGLVETKDPALADSVSDQLDKIEKSIANLGGDNLMLEVELRKKPTKLKRLYKQLQELQDQLAEVSLVLELDVHRGIQRIAPAE